MARTCLVTGASKGIGRSTAFALAREGCRLILHHRQTAEGVEGLQRAFTDGGVESHIVKSDLARPGAVEEMLQALPPRWRDVDILVNNAGAYERAPFTSVTPEQWERTIRVGVTSPFLLAKALLPGMTSRGWGRVVNVSSVLAFRGSHQGAHYTAAKAGIVGLTRALARETAGSGVTVNAVAPGAINTDIIGADTPEKRKDREAAIPLQRVGTADEVASVIAFLASDDSGAITGQTVHVNGGWWMV